MHLNIDASYHQVSVSQFRCQYHRSENRSDDFFLPFESPRKHVNLRKLRAIHRDNTSKWLMRGVKPPLAFNQELSQRRCKLGRSLCHESAGETSSRVSWTNYRQFSLGCCPTKGQNRFNGCNTDRSATLVAYTRPYPSLSTSCNAFPPQLTGRASRTNTYLVRHR